MDSSLSHSPVDSPASSTHSISDLPAESLPPGLVDESFLVTQRAKVKLPREIERDRPEFTEATQLDEKRLELEEVQVELERCREEFRRKEEELREREEMLKRTKETFIQQITDMEDITRRRVREMEKSRRRYDEERFANQQKQSQIEDLRRSLTRLSELKISRERMLRRISPYENFLSLVLQSEASFKNSFSILKRYETLQTANRELRLSVAQNKEALKKLNLDFKNYRKKTQNRLFEVNNMIREYQHQLESDRNGVKFEEQNRHTKEMNLIETTQLLSLVNMSINNLFHKCVEQDKIHGKAYAVEAGLDRVKQLDVIRKYMRLRREVMKRIRDGKRETERSERRRELQRRRAMMGYIQRKGSGTPAEEDPQTSGKVRGGRKRVVRGRGSGRRRGTGRRASARSRGRGKSRERRAERSQQSFRTDPSMGFSAESLSGQWDPIPPRIEIGPPSTAPSGGENE